MRYGIGRPPQLHRHPVTRAAELRAWLRKIMLGRLFKDASVLTAGNVAASGLDFVSLAVTAHVLGPAALGVLVLIRAYVTVIGKLLDFQSWQVLIAYGAEALERNDRRRFQQLVKFGLCLDLSAAVLGALVGVSLVQWAGRWQGWEPTTVRLATLYSVGLLVSVSGAPKGVLRLFGRFGMLAMRDIVAAAVKLAGAGIAALSHAGLAEFTVVWLVTDILGGVLLLVLGWRVLAQEGCGGALTVSMRGMTSQHPRLWGFVWSTNISGSLKAVTTEFDTLIVGGVLGAAAAGLYKVAKQCTKVISELVGPLHQVIYPELARLWARSDVERIRRLIVRSGALVGAAALLVWLGVLVVGRPLLELAFGREFIGAYEVLVWYMLAVVVSVAGFAIQPAIVAGGRPDISLWVYVSTTVVYVPVLFAAIHVAGLVGAGVAFLVYRLGWSLAMAVAQQHLLRQRYPLSGAQA